LRGVPTRDTAARVTEAEEKTTLREAHGELIGSLSHGYRQRVGLAQAMVHKPALLILDEPTAGLDPVQIVEMRNLIRQLRGDHPLLISSHFLARIGRPGDRLRVIQAGEVGASGNEEERAGRTSGPAGDIELTVRAEPARALEVVRGVPGITDVTV